MQLPNLESPPRPALLISVDTEGDDLWSRPREISTENASFMPRFQALCEKHALKPTWLANYEMAESPAFVDFARDVLQRETGEIGMHLHAWDSPPLVPLTVDDSHHQPYLTEYPEAVMRDKIRFMTDLLEDRFQRKMLTHRAGRWGFNAVYARLLVEHGYQVDCSVMPHVSWAEYLGDPNGSGGPDFTNFPEQPYFLDLDRIDLPGDSPLLEVPVSAIETCYVLLNAWFRSTPKLLRRLIRRFCPPVLTLVPRDNARNSCYLQAILRHALEHHWPCAQLAIHSSELMPGASPFFRTAKSIERLYLRLESLFSFAAGNFRGLTLSEFRAAASKRCNQSLGTVTK
jgi:hypothetical protein